jgi:serine/threonine-protein kinase
VQDDPNDPWIGQSLGSYQILRRIGFGGMGVVYLARHQSLDRLDAVKFLPEQFAQDAAYIELFFREAKAAARLSHPNVVGVHDAGSISGIYYFVMDYVEGRDLGTILKERGAFSVPDAVNYIRQAAQALAYAHKKGIIHRDIKPENLLLTSEGVIKVADLGLAKWIGDTDGTFTQGEWVLGSPIYISPERLKDPHFNDPRTDIYSLGATFFHLVTGRIPYQGSSPVIMSQHLTAPVPDPTESNPVIESRVSVIIRKMLAKELADRYQTMEEVDSALADFQSGKVPVKSVPLPTPFRTATHMKSPAPSGAPASGGSGKKIALIAVVVLIALGAGWFFYSRPDAIAKPQAKAATPSVAPSQKAAVISSSTMKLADFNQQPGNDSLYHFQGTAGPCEQRIDPGAGFEGSGAWRIDFDISRQGADGRAPLELRNVDATGYRDVMLRIRTGATTPISIPIELKIGPAMRRYVVRDINTEWKMVRIPLQSLAFPSLKPLTEITIVLERGTTAVKQGNVYIDDLALSKE